MTLMTISLGLLAGLITDQLLTPGFRFWYLTLTLSALLFFLAKKEARFYALDHPLKKIMIAGCVAACFALGGIRSELERETRVRTVPFADRDGKESVCVEAVVIAPAVETKTRLSVTVRMIADCAERADRPKPSAKAILILPPETAAPVYGNRLRIAGVPSAVPEKSRSAYFNDLRRNDITHIFHKPDLTVLPGFYGAPFLDWIYRLRASFSARVSALFPPPENALIAGILIGDESKIPAEIDDAFRATGTAHVIAISGMNFTVLIWLIAALVRKLSNRWWTPLTLLPLILIYTLLTGASPPIIRAAILSALTLLGDAFGESKECEASLAFSAAAMAAVEPRILFDAGFQLSVMATLGILMFNRSLTESARRILTRLGLTDKKRLADAVELLNELILTTLSAQVFTTFIGAAAFGRISWVSPPCNAAIALFQSPIMIGGFAALILSFIFMPLGNAVAAIMTPAATLTIEFVRLFAKIPGGNAYFKLSAAQAWYICAAIIILWKLRAGLKPARRELPSALLTGLALIAAIAFWRIGLGRLRLIPDRYEIQYRERRGMMTLTIRTPRRNELVIGEKLNGYEAEALIYQPGWDRFARRAAWITTAEPWIAERIAADYRGTPEFLIVNGVRVPDRRRTDELALIQDEPIEEELLAIRLGDVRVSAPARFFGREARRIRIGRLAILIPNGIAPERFLTEDPRGESAAAEELLTATLILIGRADSRALWSGWLSERAAREPWRNLPELIPTDGSSEFTIRSDGERLFIKPGKRPKISP